MKISLLTVATLMIALPSCHAEDIVNSSVNRESAQITLFERMAYISEVRSADLKKGTDSIVFRDFSRSVDEETFQLSLQDNSKTEIKSVSFVNPVSNSHQVVNQYIGKTAVFDKKDDEGGLIERIEGELIAADGRYVIRTSEGIRVEEGLNPILEDEGHKISGRPEVVAEVSTKGGPEQFNIGYLSNSISWYPRYRLLIRDEDNKADLQGWAIIRNQSPEGFNAAKLTLIAGDIQTVSNHHSAQPKVMRMAMADMAMQESSSFESSNDRYVYRVAGEKDIPSSGTIQVPIVDPKTLNLKTVYELRPGGNISYFPRRDTDKLPVNVIWKAKADENDSPTPTPKGIVDLFIEDKGREIYFGSVQLADTSAGDVIEIRSGSAFDVYGKKKQIDNTVLSKRIRQLESETTVVNRKDEKVTVDLYEQVWGDWSVISSSHAHTKDDANHLKFSVTVPAKSEVAVRYRVEIQN